MQRGTLACTNLAHGFAAFPANDKLRLREQKQPSVAIVSSYNDMLSAHQPFEYFPKVIKDAVREVGAVAQFAGGVPAMCDGVTQGQPGMELSLFSRDTIAMSTAIALSHNMFDAALYLGICDKIVPGLLIGALHFGHIPGIFVPGGPMTTGISNKEKAAVRQRYAQGRGHARGTAGRRSPGLPRRRHLHLLRHRQQQPDADGNDGPAPAGRRLHHAGHAAARRADRRRRPAAPSRSRSRAASTCRSATSSTRRCIVNAIVALHATGGSTNHTLHLVAIARAAGIVIDWDDFDELSKVVPLLARIYPNGDADVNHFQAAGGPAFVIRELLDAGLAHDDVNTILGHGLRAHCKEPFLDGDKVVWRDLPEQSGDENVLRKPTNPFSAGRRPGAGAGQPGPRRDEDLGGQEGAPHRRGAGA